MDNLRIVPLGDAMRVQSVGGVRVARGYTAEDLAGFVRSATLSESVGMASEVTLTLSLWDTGSRSYHAGVMDTLFHGERFELWDGQHCMGAYQVEERGRDYSPEGPTLEVTAFDGLRRLMKITKSRVYHGTSNDTEWLEALAGEHGMVLDADPSQWREFKSDRFKALGETDLAFVKQAAMAQGLGMPRVEYDPRTGVERLVVRALDVHAAQQGKGLDLRVHRPDGDGDLSNFRTNWDTGDMPVAVDVVGWDARARKAYRVTAVATPRGPVVESVDRRDISAKELRQVRTGKGVVVNLLGDGREQVDSRKRTTVTTSKGKRTYRAKREFREILHTTFAQGVKDAEAYAVAWLRTRMEAYYTCEGAVVANASGISDVRTHSVLRVSEAAAEDNGWYVVTDAEHHWDEEGRAVGFKGQRLLLSTKVG